MPRRQYAAVPSNDVDDNELEQAFAISDDEDAGRETHDRTPLLPPTEEQGEQSPLPVQTPRTVHSQRTINGRYNFDYDFPPPGSPPTDRAGVNHWGNTNGVVIAGPINYNFHSSQGNWFSRAWSSLRGGNSRGIEPSGRIGGGSNNDGVFANLSSRPTNARRANATRDTAQQDDVEIETIFHAPEVARDDAPPSYWAAQADTAPPYWENTVHATVQDEFLIDSIPAGSIFGFLGVISPILGGMAQRQAWESPLYDSGSGSGTALKETTTLLDYLEKSGGPARMPHPLTQPLPPPDYPVCPTTRQVAHIIIQLQTLPCSTMMVIGWFIFMSSLLGFWRVKRWERSIRASQAETVAQEESEQEDASNSNQTPDAVNVRSTSPITAQLRDAELGGLPPIHYSREHEGVAEHDHEAAQNEERLRRDLASVGYF
ncbi:1971_t:CDS:2 [Acaulospora colombiana]|uniref:1971_t:CDS:1 n=1 Tax=Acaulospora colombiana TaxID=27376 RepID=A0ACA9KIV8_9GLOM|nr:1971_t:CDS:2 [Acaulospora colombiana]